MKIAFDIDGTLYSIVPDHSDSNRMRSKQVPNYELIVVLHWFVNNGDTVYAWSAGGVDHAQTIINKLGLDRLVIVIPKKGYREADLVPTPEMDICFDDEEVLLAKVNIKIK